MNKLFNFALKGPEKVMFEAYRDSLGVETSVKDAVMRLLMSEASKEKPEEKLSALGKPQVVNAYLLKEKENEIFLSVHMDIGDIELKLLKVRYVKKTKQVSIIIPGEKLPHEGGWVHVPCFSLRDREQHKKLLREMQLAVREWMKKEGI